MAGPPRIRAIDWLRGLVMMLMTIDHAGDVYDAHHFFTDGAFLWKPGTPIPPGEFLTRWLTHLCAPTFVLLAGTSLALSTEKRRDQPGQTAFIVKRGLLIAALDPLWMSMVLLHWHPVLLQVLYAIGMSLVCMAFLRRLSTRALLVIAVAIQLGGELSTYVPMPGALRPLWALLFTGGPVGKRLLVGYPLIPWLSIMIFGWVLGRWLVATRERDNASRVPAMATLGAVLLALFVVVRGIDRYGNWGLHRESMAFLQWLHVAKYPPSIAYTTLELGLAFLLLALFFKLDDGSERPLLKPFALFGATAFFYYVLHFHLLAAVETFLLHLDRDAHGLRNTYLATVCVLVALAGPCAWYRRYKRAHPDGWTRYV